MGAAKRYAPADGKATWRVHVKQRWRRLLCDSNPTSSKTNHKPNPTDHTNPTLLTLTLFERLAKNFHRQESE